MNKKITLYNNRTARNDPPESLQEHIAWLQGMLESIPEEFRSSSDIEMYADEYRMEYEVSYERPETAEELETKAKDEAARTEKRRQQELARLAELRAKYPEANAKGHGPRERNDHE